MKNKMFALKDIFDIYKGKRLTKADMISGDTNYLGAISDNNCIREKIVQEPIFKGNCITINYNGSVGEAFYQIKPFWASDDVNVLFLKNKILTKNIALYLVTIIKANKYRFSYGRKWTLEKMLETEIPLPTNENNCIEVDIKLSNNIFLKKFDIISIHQGLLDKGYGQFDIHDDYQKEEVTKAIFDCFSKSSGKAIVIDQKGNLLENEAKIAKCKYFLPKFIIHSGRSKPNHKDMPQQLPFLQFSAIDHAVRDCKSTLTELFYSAHYE